MTECPKCGQSFTRNEAKKLIEDLVNDFDLPWYWEPGSGYKDE